MQVKSFVSSALLFGVIAFFPAINNNQVAAKSAPKAPDLVIKRVSEKGNKATVLIKNIGSEASKPCVLIVYGGIAFNVTSPSIKIPPIPVSGSQVINVVAGAAPSPSLYFVDATNTVSELVESNNVALVP